MLNAKHLVANLSNVWHPLTLGNAFGSRVLGLPLYK